MGFGRAWTLRACVVAVLVATPLAHAQDAASAKRSYASFSELRGTVLEAISGATKRVWLVTDYLTDGEIVTALYVAQYRKLDVKVLLGRARANAYMSRLNYLKNQNVPVFLKPDTFKPGAPTMILADDRLLKVEGELDVLAKYRRFDATTGSSSEAAAYANSFATAANLRVPAVPVPTPLVGRAGASGGGRSGGGLIYSPPQPRYNPQDGAYVYDRAAEPRPADVPAKLPKSPKYETRGKPDALKPPPPSSKMKDPEPAESLPPSPPPAGGDL